jgi:hypothetical protein
MKVNLTVATASAATFVLALSVSLGTNAIGAPSAGAPGPSAVNGPRPSPTPAKTFKLKCVGIGVTIVQISDVGDAAVPAGTVAQWQVVQGTVVVQGHSYTMPARGGSYTFGKPLDPGQQINVTLATPAPGGSGSGQPDINSSLGVGLTVPGLLAQRICTISTGPVRAPSQLQMHPH